MTGLILWVICGRRIGFVPDDVQGRIGHCTSVTFIAYFKLIFVALAGGDGVCDSMCVCVALGYILGLKASRVV